MKKGLMEDFSDLKKNVEEGTLPECRRECEIRALQ